MVVLDESLLPEYSKKVKKGLWLCLLPLGVALCVCAGLCFLINADKTNADLIHFFAVLITVIVGWFSLTVLLGKVVPNAKRKKTIKKILSYARKQVVCTITAMDKSFTTQEGVNVLEIEVVCDGKKLSFYYDNSAAAPQFAVGDTVKITTSHNYVVEYEVESNEKEV